jgi:hypothetical protein
MNNFSINVIDDNTNDVIIFTVQYNGTKTVQYNNNNFACSKNLLTCFYDIKWLGGGGGLCRYRPCFRVML